MTTTLSALDDTFLELEDGNPGAHMHLGAVLVLDAPQGAIATPAANAAQVRERMLEHLAGLPRLTQRLSTPDAGGLRRPHWVEDERFDLSRHLRRAALPEPGGRLELEAWCGEFFGRRLDRAHPLWEMVVLEGLEDDRWALATKLHHCLADGIGSLGIAEILFVADDARDAATVADRPGDHRSLLGKLADVPLDLAEAGIEVLRHPRRVGDAAQSTLAATELLAGELTHRPLPCLSAPLGAQRRFATVTVPLRDLQAIEQALGGTINDAVLAIVAGALRRLLLSCDVPLPPDGVRAMVPVDARASGQEAVGNRISSLFVDLPVATETPLARHAAVRRATAERKHAGQAAGSSTVLRLAELAPPALHQVLAGLFATPRLFDLTVTNVRGPQQPIHLAGSRVREIHPLVPLAPDHALGVAVVSHAGSMTFGIVADFDAVPDLDELVAGVRAEHDELRRLAARRARAAHARAVTSAIDGTLP
jgi:diacylglycerol O-acyltransferase